MKQFHDETLAGRQAATSVIETAWRVLDMVKTAVGRQPASGLTLTQMRSLGFLVGSPGASLSELADDLGLQMPTTSKVVEEMVRQKWIVREVVPGNRRKLTLRITAKGRKAVAKAAEPAMTRMAELLAQLTTKERQTVERAVTLLLPLVTSARLRDDSETNAA
ncbi:MAG: MarR family transcriptional regulator [Gemmatimonadaceae bacterium]